MKGLSGWMRKGRAAMILMILAAGLTFAANGQEEGGDTVAPEYDKDLNFAQVVYVKATEVSPAVWRFDVTVQHDDAGWDHYADRWEVLAPDGSLLGVRELLHPHVDEQPFTRSLSGVRIDPSIGRVKVRARDSIHGFGGESFEVELPR